MKGFLFDENIPARLTFTPSFPIIPFSQFGLSPTDSIIGQQARTNAWVIVSKDTDFSNRIVLSNPPPWVVHLRFGNLRKREFHAFLARVWPQIESLLPEHKLINVYLDRIEAMK